jgi:hypothetical protein
MHMQGGGYEDVLPLLQVPDSAADAHLMELADRYKNLLEATTFIHGHQPGRLPATAGHIPVTSGKYCPLFI